MNTADIEIQLDFEEAALLSWPILLPSPFLASLERSERNYLYGHSLVILAHFYLVNTLVDAWFVRGSFEREILKINAIVGTLNESQLSTFMLWPNKVMNLSLAYTPLITYCRSVNYLMVPPERSWAVMVGHKLKLLKIPHDHLHQ